MNNRPVIHYSGLYLTTIVFVAGLVVATLVQVSAVIHELLDVGVILVTFGLLAIWIGANASTLKDTRMEGWRHRPLVLNETVSQQDELNDRANVSIPTNGARAGHPVRSQKREPRSHPFSGN